MRTDGASSRTLRVGFILGRFPSLTETFVMRELHWIRGYDVEVYIFPLLSPKAAPVHKQAIELLPRVRYSPFISVDVARAQIRMIRRSPRRYLIAIAKLICQTYREPGVLLRALAIFPKSVYFACQMEYMGINHVHAQFVWLQGLAAGVVSDLLGITFSIRPHAFDLFMRNQRNVRAQLENATKIITISEYHRHYISALCPQIGFESIDVVHCGVDADRYRHESVRRVIQPLVILSVGSLIEKKGHEYLLEACSLLSERGLDFRCDIVGVGPLKKKFEAHISRLDLRSKVSLLGALDESQVLEAYHRSQIFVLACVRTRRGDQDGIPVALMEAMACELPVITTAVAGIPSLVHQGRTGWLVEERDALGLANALDVLIRDDSLRQQLGERGRRMILERFQIQHTAARLAEIFRQVSGPLFPNQLPIREIDPLAKSGDTE